MGPGPALGSRTRASAQCAAHPVSHRPPGRSGAARDLARAADVLAFDHPVVGVTDDEFAGAPVGCFQNGDPSRVAQARAGDPGVVDVDLPPSLAIEVDSDSEFICGSGHDLKVARVDGLRHP